MRYIALACDYDGTIAADGLVDPSTLKSLQQLRESGRRLILVTGRELPDLLRVLPHIDVFDRVVAENGALVYRPDTRTETALGPPPRPEFVESLRRRGVTPLSVGRVIVATWEPQQEAVLEAIRELGLELQVIFNKGAVMVLPSGVNKATGLTAALESSASLPAQLRWRRRRRERPRVSVALRVLRSGGQRVAGAQGGRDAGHERDARRGRERAGRSAARNGPARAR